MKTAGIKCIRTGKPGPAGLLPPAIDFHTHLNLSGTRPVTLARIMAQARRAGIVHMVVLGDVLRFGPRPTQAQVQKINDDTRASVRAHPRFLTGFCFLNPRHSMHFNRREIARCIDGAGFRGIKLENSLAADDPRVDPIAEEAGRRGVVLLHHTWDTSIIGRCHGRGIQSSPADLAALAERFPGTRFVMAHLTAAGAAGILAIKHLANVMVDTSGSQPFAGIVAYAVAELGARRILFGSDVTGRDFAPQLGRITGAPISAAAKRRILFENARAILFPGETHAD